MSPGDVTVPTTFLAYAARGEDWATWLEALPRVVAELVEDWALTPDGAAAHGETALVLPVRTAEGRPAVLKVTWPHWEAEHEHLALRAWGGRGAVELLRADPHRWALLLERLEPRDLTTLPLEDACTVIAQSYRRLHGPALPQPRRLSEVVRSWGERLAGLPNDAPVPRRMVERAVSLARSFAQDPATDGHLLHADLHFTNVLAGRREPWLVIDPKPLAGDPHLEPAPLVWNRWPETVATGDVRGTLRRRLDLVCEVAELDRDRVRDWAVVRETANVLWTIEDAQRLGRGLLEDERTWITRAITSLKALQP